MRNRPVVYANKHFRGDVSSGRDKKFFSATADKTHVVNLRKTVMRGGIRL